MGYKIELTFLILHSQQNAFKVLSRENESKEFSQQNESKEFSQELGSNQNDGFNFKDSEPDGSKGFDGLEEEDPLASNEEKTLLDEEDA